MIYARGRHTAVSYARRLWVDLEENFSKVDEFYWMRGLRPIPLETEASSSPGAFASIVYSSLETLPL
jgi:hypothetical protein